MLQNETWLTELAVAISQIMLADLFLSGARNLSWAIFAESSVLSYDVVRAFVRMRTWMVASYFYT